MIVDFYTNEKKNKVVLLPPGKDLSSLSPEGQIFANGLKKLEQKEILADQPLTGLNTAEAIESINTKGYYAATIDIRIEFTES